jgi:hypothetical protein
MRDIEINRPRLRPGAGYSFAPTSSGATINYREETLEVTFPVEARHSVECLLDRLTRGGLTIGELECEIPQLATHIPTIIAELDHSRFLTETSFAEPKNLISGQQLYNLLVQLVDRLKRRLADSSFFHLLETGQAKRAHLIGYALEYHHIVNSAPGLIAPMLASSLTDIERAIAQDFLRSELGHDKFVKQSARAVGIPPSVLERRVPLGSTFVLCASLGVFARQDPISFKACVSLFEDPNPDFFEAFEYCCRERGLSEDFYLPLRQHYLINLSEEHESISARFLRHVPIIDEECRLTVTKNVAFMVETLLLQEKEIISYYGDSANSIERTF